jgi:hypothetical protein
MRGAIAARRTSGFRSARARAKRTRLLEMPLIRSGKGSRGRGYRRTVLDSKHSSAACTRGPRCFGRLLRIRSSAAAIRSRRCARDLGAPCGRAPQSHGSRRSPRTRRAARPRRAPAARQRSVLAGAAAGSSERAPPVPQCRRAAVARQPGEPGVARSATGPGRAPGAAAAAVRRRRCPAGRPWSRQPDCRPEPTDERAR